MTARQVMEAIRPYVDRGEAPGAVVGMWRDGEVSLDAAGVVALDGGAPLTVDTVMRISSNTKPMTAALALALAEDGVLALDDPVERFVPELAGRRVLQHDALSAAGCEQILIDHASGKLARQPELERALAVAGRSGDQLVITSSTGSALYVDPAGVVLGRDRGIRGTCAWMMRAVLLSQPGRPRRPAGRRRRRSARPPVRSLVGGSG